MSGLLYILLSRQEASTYHLCVPQFVAKDTTCLSIALSIHSLILSLCYFLFHVYIVYIILSLSLCICMYIYTLLWIELKWSTSWPFSWWMCVYIYLYRRTRWLYRRTNAKTRVRDERWREKKEVRFVSKRGPSKSRRDARSFVSTYNIPWD